MSRKKSPEEKAYWEWLKSLPCAVSFVHPQAGTVDRHHIRRHKYGASGSVKPPDWFSFPLEHSMHMELHKGDKTWEENHKIQEVYLIKTWRRYGLSNIPPECVRLVEEWLGHEI